jgi:hypothetical protein
MSEPKKSFSTDWTKTFDPPAEWDDMPPVGRGGQRERRARARSTRALLLGARDVFLALVNALSSRLARATFRRRY